MKVSDILRVKGNALFTVPPDTSLETAAANMAAEDIGSLVVMAHGAIAGLLTFRELIRAMVDHGDSFPTLTVGDVMDTAPLTCSPDTPLDDVRRMVLGSRARYLPVLEGRELLGVISLYDVAHAVVESQAFENRMLKAYIRDWPHADAQA